MNFLEALELLHISVTNKIYRSNNNKMRVNISSSGELFVERKDASQGWSKAHLTFDDMLANDWKFDR